MNQFTIRLHLNNKSSERILFSDGEETDREKLHYLLDRLFNELVVNKKSKIVPIKDKINFLKEKLAPSSLDPVYIQRQGKLLLKIFNFIEKKYDEFVEFNEGKRTEVSFDIEDFLSKGKKLKI